MRGNSIRRALAAGFTTIAVTAATLVGTSGAAPAQTPVATGRSDVVWHNSTSNETQIWFMNGHQIIQRRTVVAENGFPIFIGTPWRIVGSGDLNGNGGADIVWHNSSTNETQVWFMNEHRIVQRATVVGEGGLPIFVGAPWRIAGIGDVSGNGVADIVWHNSTTNETQIWAMNGNRIVQRATVVAENSLPIFIGLPWRIAGSGDLNANAIADIVWHNGSSNETQVWFMSGNRIVQRATVVDESGFPIFIGAPWRIAAIGDLGL